MILLRKSEPIYCLAKMSPTASEMSDIFMNNRRLLYLLYWTAVVSNNTKLMQTKPILQCYCRPESNPFQQDSYPEAQLRNFKSLPKHPRQSLYKCSIAPVSHFTIVHVTCVAVTPLPPLPQMHPSYVASYVSIAASPSQVRTGFAGAGVEPSQLPGSG